MKKEIKKKNFFCPHCQGNLRPNDKIIMGIITEYDKKELILLSPRPGNYGYITPLNLEKGEKVKLFCPICGESLESKKYPNLCHVIMENEILYFSPIVGEHATFLEDLHGKITRSWGEHAQNYNFGEKHELNNVDAEIIRTTGFGC